MSHQHLTYTLSTAGLHLLKTHIASQVRNKDSSCPPHLPNLPALPILLLQPHHPPLLPRPGHWQLWTPSSPAIRSPSSNKVRLLKAIPSCHSPAENPSVVPHGSQDAVQAPPRGSLDPQDRASTHFTGLLSCNPSTWTPSSLCSISATELAAPPIFSLSSGPCTPWPGACSHLPTAPPPSSPR